MSVCEYNVSRLEWNDWLENMIGIIDYGLGNLRSVQKAFEAVNRNDKTAREAKILSEWSDLTSDISHLVLPGVGAYRDAMDKLTAQNWIDPIRSFLQTGKPFLGICLGMQLLFDGSEEDAGEEVLVPGLSILSGKVLQFSKNMTKEVKGATKERVLKVPHMGWNQLTWQVDDPLMEGVEQGASVYFVHSYYVAPNDSQVDPITSTTSDYGVAFCASVWQGNVWATQFHPEKSQDVGLAMLKNFSDL